MPYARIDPNTHLRGIPIMTRQHSQLTHNAFIGTIAFLLLVPLSAPAQPTPGPDDKMVAEMVTAGGDCILNKVRPEG